MPRDRTTGRDLSRLTSPPYVGIPGAGTQTVPLDPTKLRDVAEDFGVEQLPNELSRCVIPTISLNAGGVGSDGGYEVAHGTISANSTHEPQYVDWDRTRTRIVHLWRSITEDTAGGTGIRAVNVYLWGADTHDYLWGTAGGADHLAGYSAGGQSVERSFLNYKYADFKYLISPLVLPPGVDLRFDHYGVAGDKTKDIVVFTYA